MATDAILSRTFNTVFVAHIFLSLSFFMFVHLPRFLAGIGADEAEIGLLIGVGAVATVAVRMASGRFMDIYGRRPVLLIGASLNVAAILLYMTVSSLGVWVVVVRVIHGIAEGAMFTALYIYVADVIPASRRTEGLAIFGISGFIPIGLGGLLGDLLLEGGGFDRLFLTAAGVGIVGWSIAATLREVKPPLGRGRRGAGLFTVVSQRSLLPVWLAVSVFAVTIGSYFTFLRTFVDEVGFGSVGGFFSAYAVSTIALRVFFSWVPERVGEKRLLFPAFGALAAGAAVVATAGSARAVIFAGALTGIGHGYVFPILLAIAVTRAPDSGRGSALAFFTAILNLGVLIGGPILGLIIITGGYTTMYLSVMAFTVVGAASFALWDRRHDPAHAAAG